MKMFSHTSVMILVLIYLSSCNQAVRKDTAEQPEAQTKEVIKPKEQVAENLPQEEVPSSDQKPSALVVAMEHDAQRQDQGESNTSDQQKVRDYLVLIKSLNLPKNLKLEKKNYPLYHDLTKDEYERVTFQDSVFFGKSRCKKVVEEIKTKNINSKLLSHFDDTNLCGFWLTGATTYTIGKNQFSHRQVPYPSLFPAKILEVLLDATGSIVANVYTLVLSETKYKQEIKMNMPNGQYLESFVNYNKALQTFTQKTTSLDRVSERFRFEYYITNEKNESGGPYAHTKLEYRMADDQLFTVNEYETTEKRKSLKCEMLITKGSDILFKKVMSERCF